MSSGSTLGARAHERGIIASLADAKMPAMRTTIRIDDDLYRAVKERAARSGRTVASVLEDAVRAGMDPPAASVRRPAYEVRASGAGGLLPGVDVGSNASVREALDADLPPDALR